MELASSGLKLASLTGGFVGLAIVILIVSVILTFIWKKITKKEITRNEIIISTIIAGFIYLLFSKRGSEQLTMFIILVMAVLVVIWERSKNLQNKPMKEKIKNNNIHNKKKCKICLWRNNINANYCEQCGYRLVKIFYKIPFLSKIKCKCVNQKFRYCSECGRILNYHYKIDLTDNWTPNPYTDENIKRIQKKWYQFWR